MRQNDDIFCPSLLNYEAWRDFLRSKCGRYYSEGIEPAAFTGWVRPVSARGFTVTDIGCNSHRVERTYRDVRLDGADHYFVVFLVRGQLAMIHNDQTVRQAAGDVVFVDAARPVTYLVDNPGAVCNTVSLSLPRQSLVAHLGFEPPGGLYQPGRPLRRRWRHRNRIVRAGSGQSAIHAFGDLNFAIFLPRTESMRAIALQYVAITRFGRRVRWRTKRCAPVLMKGRVRCTTPSSR